MPPDYTVLLNNHANAFKAFYEKITSTMEDAGYAFPPVDPDAATPSLPDTLKCDDSKTSELAGDEEKDAQAGNARFRSQYLAGLWNQTQKETTSKPTTKPTINHLAVNSAQQIGATNWGTPGVR